MYCREKEREREREGGGERERERERERVRHNCNLLKCSTAQLKELESSLLEEHTVPIR